MATLPNLELANFFNLLPIFTALPMLRIPLTRLVTTQVTAFTVAPGAFRNAIPKNIGAADSRNCPNPNNPCRDMGFSINLINPSNDDPTRNDVIFQINLPTAASPSASFWTFSGFLEIQSSAANAMKSLKIPPRNPAIARKNPPKADFAAFLKASIFSPSTFFFFFSLFSSSSALFCFASRSLSALVFFFSLSASALSAAISCFLVILSPLILAETLSFIA